jgi:alkaline phosphatase
MRELHQKNPKLTFAEAQKLLTQYFGLKFTGELKKDPLVVTKTQLQLLEEGFNKKKLADAVRVVMSQKAGIGWTTGAHTALPVLTTATGVQAKRFSGFIDNTDIANILKSLLK